MSFTLLEYAKTRDNNFNLIRFLAATLVLFTHSYALTGRAEPLGSSIGMTWGSIAVDVFFVTSGFLIASSFFGRDNLLAFTWARLLRIYPALIVAVLFCVFIVGLSFTTNSAVDYMSSPHVYAYLKKNVILISGVSYELPGVFENNPFKASVNGSLWTLPYELKMYAYLAVVGYVLLRIQKWLKKDVVKVMFFGVAIIAVALNIYNHFSLVTDGPFLQLFSMFFAGAGYYVCRDKVYLSIKAFCFILFALLLALINKDLYFIAYCLLLPYLTFFIAYVPAGKVRCFNSLGDYSYGIYIYAFPVQQSIVAIFPGLSVAVMIMLSFTVTLLLAVLSWHFVEKKFLKMKGGYRAIESVLTNIRFMVVSSRQK